jgi:hypothetical protein
MPALSLGGACRSSPVPALLGARPPLEAKEMMGDYFFFIYLFLLCEDLYVE